MCLYAIQETCVVVCISREQDVALQYTPPCDMCSSVYLAGSTQLHTTTRLYAIQETCVVVCISREQAAACPTINTTLFTKKKLIFVQQKRPVYSSLQYQYIQGSFHQENIGLFSRKEGSALQGGQDP